MEAAGENTHGLSTTTRGTSKHFTTFYFSSKLFSKTKFKPATSELSQVVVNKGRLKRVKYKISKMSAVPGFLGDLSFQWGYREKEPE